MILRIIRKENAMRLRRVRHGAHHGFAGSCSVYDHVYPGIFQDLTNSLSVLQRQAATPEMTERQLFCGDNESHGSCAQNSTAVFSDSLAAR